MDEELKIKIKKFKYFYSTYLAGFCGGAWLFGIPSMFIVEDFKFSPVYWWLSFVLILFLCASILYVYCLKLEAGEHV